MAIGVGEGQPGIRVVGMVCGDGIPLDRGTIRLCSVSGEPLIGVGAFIKAGEFVIESSQGLIPGEYMVQVSGHGEAEMKALARGQQDGSIPTPEDPIPACYNLRSKMVVKLSEASPHRLDVDLALAPGAGR